MTKLDFAFLLAASVSSGSVAFDREAVVTQFEQPLGVESAKQHDEGFVPNVMGSHFRALQNEPDMPTIQSRLHVSRLLARDSYWTQLDRININSMHSTLCSSRTYPGLFIGFGQKGWREWFKRLLSCRKMGV